MKKVFLYAALAAMCLACAACGDESIEFPGEKLVVTSDVVMDLGRQVFLGSGMHAYGGVDDGTVVIYAWPSSEHTGEFMRLNIPVDQAVGTKIDVTRASRIVIKSVGPGQMTVTRTKLD